MEKRFVVASVVAVGVAVAGAVLWYLPRDTSSVSSVFDSDSVASSTASVTSTASDAVSTAFDAAPIATSTPVTQDAGQVAGVAMRRYSNPSFHFSLLYPAALQATEYHEQGGALTVTFEHPGEDQQFQIYVTPYAGNQVSAERFKQDVPSGVRDQPTEIIVGGTKAVMFFSRNAIMGDTREVWFIYPEPPVPSSVEGGRGVQTYLYEVTTYKELDAWLAAIMATWKFISP